MTKTTPLATKTKLNPIQLILFLAAIAAFGIYIIFRGHAAGGCDFTYNNTQVSTIQNTVSTTANAGRTVCLSAGAYPSSITFSGTHANDITVQPDPAGDPNGAGKVTIPGINIGNNASHIIVRGLYSTKGIDFGPGSNFITLDHNDVTNPSGFGISIATNITTDADGHDLTIFGNRIHDTAHTTEGDALRLQGWYNVTITQNEIYNIYESPSCQSGGTDTCHTDCLQSYQIGNSYNGRAHDFVYDHNYLHDNNCQAFFLKDGDVTPNVAFTNNLWVRNNNPLGISGFNSFWVDENTVGMVVRGNTVLDNGSSALSSLGSTPSPTLAFDHNVFNSINKTGPASYTITNDYNIYTGNNQWNWPAKATHEQYGTSGVSYQCGSSCGNGTKAGDDYRLVTQPYSGQTLGINWKPADYVYGPVTQTTSSSDTTSPSTPTGLTATLAPVTGSVNTNVNLSWTASTDNVGVTGYTVYRDGVSVGTSTTTTFIDTSAPVGKTKAHTYTVTAHDAVPNTSAASSSSSSVTIYVIADVNHDDTVDFLDLSQFLAKYGSNDTNFDINHSGGTVDVFDLSLLLARYGSGAGGGGTACATSTPNVADGPDPWGGCFPGPSNTGVPASLVSTLTPYSGCSVDQPSSNPDVTIDNKTINCPGGFTVGKTTNLVIKNSRVNGIIYNDDSSGFNGTVTIQDSEISAGQTGFGAVSYQNITIQRSNVQGGQHNVQCSHNCTIADSYLHNSIAFVDSSSGYGSHNNAFISNGGDGFTVKHTTLSCSTTPINDQHGGTAGCSADLSLFGDFSPISNVTIDSDLFIASTNLSYCLYAGDNSSKPYGAQANNITVKNNIFQKGTNSQCGFYNNSAVTDFNSSDPTSSWANNKYSDGTLVAP